MKKAKLLLSSFFITVSFLFSGFYLYQTVAVAQPIIKQAEQIPEIKLSQKRVSPKEIQLTIQVQKPFPFIDRYPVFLEQVQKNAGDRKLNIQIQDRPNTRLQEVWQESELAVQEGLALKRYTLIEDRLHENAQKVGVAVDVRIVKDNLYVSLTDRNHFLLRVLPLSERKKGEL